MVAGNQYGKLMFKKPLRLLFLAGIFLLSCAHSRLILIHDTMRPNTKVLERAIEMVDLVKREVSRPKNSKPRCPTSQLLLTEKEAEVFLATPSSQVAHAEQIKENDEESFSILLDRRSSQPQSGYRFFSISVVLSAGCIWYSVGFSTHRKGEG